MRPQEAGGAAATGGLPFLTTYIAPPGNVYNIAAVRFWPYDVSYGGVASDWTDFSVFDVQPTSIFSGSPVNAVVLLVEGTYRIETTFIVTVKTGTVASVILDLDEDGGVPPSQVAPGRIGSNVPDSWYNAPGAPTTAAVFTSKLFAVNAGQAPVSITPSVIPAGVGTLRASTTFNVTQLLPTALVV